MTPCRQSSVGCASEGILCGRTDAGDELGVCLFFFSFHFFYLIQNELDSFCTKEDDIRSIKILV